MPFVNKFEDVGTVETINANVIKLIDTLKMQDNKMAIINNNIVNRKGFPKLSL